MDTSFVCKLFEENTFLGTAFFINNNYAYTADHCFGSIVDYDNCYLEVDGIKYTIHKVVRIKEIDLAEIKTSKNVENVVIPYFNSDCISDEESLECFGYKETTNGEIVAVPMRIFEYPLNLSQTEISDCGFMINNEVDNAKWFGVSGAPIFDGKSIRGMVLRNIGGEGLKTRLKVISFNKIIDYLLSNKYDNMIENLPKTYMNSMLLERIENNKRKCNNLYYSQKYNYLSTNIEFITNFMQVYNNINVTNMTAEIKKSIKDYALFLQERRSTTSLIDDDTIDTIFSRLQEVSDRMHQGYNIAYIILWLLTEGIIGAPRIGRIIVGGDPFYREEDIYIKSGENKIILVVPIVAAYENIYDSITKVIDEIIIREKDTSMQFQNIEWDASAIDGLDIKTGFKIGNIIRNELKDEYDVEIVSLALWNSNMYSERPSIMNTENRIKQYMNDRFTQEMEYSDNEKYCELCYKENNRFGIKVTLFAMPLDNIENIKQ